MYKIDVRVHNQGIGEYFYLYNNDSTIHVPQSYPDFEGFILDLIYRADR